jgi:hypothetical protein
LFHGRFAPDPRWNPPYLTEDRSLEDELSRLEEAYSAIPAFMDPRDAPAAYDTPSGAMKKHDRIGIADDVSRARHQE